MRVEWEPYDVFTSSGIRAEVKSSAYLQTWPQRGLSRVTFGGLRSRTCSDGRGFMSALVTATRHEDYDALDVDGWEFYVVARGQAGRAGPGQRRTGRGAEAGGRPGAQRRAGCSY